MEAAVWRRPAGLQGLGDLAGFQTACAHIHATGGLAHENPYLLEVGIEAPLGGDHRVTAALSERRTLPAAVTYLGHIWGSLAALQQIAQRRHAHDGLGGVAALVALV